MRERERATSHQDGLDAIYDDRHSAARRYGVSRIVSRRMNGRIIHYPASWDSERRTGRAERDARIAEIRRSLSL